MRKFLKWFEDLSTLNEIRIPRRIGNLTSADCEVSMHSFGDASDAAYACAVFLRIATPGSVVVQLLAAKARIAPADRISIPRLELLAATISARWTS